MTEETLEAVKKVLSGEWHLCRGEKIRKFSVTSCSLCLPGGSTLIIELWAMALALQREQDLLEEDEYQSEMACFDNDCATYRGLAKRTKERKELIELEAKKRMDKEWTRTEP